MKSKEIECFKVVRYLYPVFKFFCIRSKDTLDLIYELNKTTYPTLVKYLFLMNLKVQNFLYTVIIIVYTLIIFYVELELPLQK